ncbi:MAG: ABC transporter ATP-binding protein [Desulfobacterales bacterium]
MADGRPATPLLEARRLCKGYNNSDRRIEILKDVHFQMATGETVAVVGASGIGKSTLLHVFGTLDRPDSGTLAYGGQDVFKLSHGELSRFRNRTIGFVFQFHHLLPEFSALENVAIPGLIRGDKKSHAKATAREILVRVGLENRLDHRVVKLSGGEQQRVALARALVLKPALLLADEPTGNLDKRNSEQIHELLLGLNRELGMALVVVTHNLELAAIMTRRITIREGRLAEEP